MPEDQLIRILTPEERAYREEFLKGIEETLRGATPKDKARIMALARTYDTRPGYRGLQKVLEARSHRQ